MAAVISLLPGMSGEIKYLICLYDLNYPVLIGCPFPPITSLAEIIPYTSSLLYTFIIYMSTLETKSLFR